MVDPTSTAGTPATAATRAPARSPPQEASRRGPDRPQKAYNYSVNRLRAAVERAISHLKNWKILNTGYRRIVTDFSDVLRTVTALETFRTTTSGLNDPPGLDRAEAA